MTTGLLILTGVVGLALGIWLGLPGRYQQSADDIEKIMESGGARRRRTRRMFTPLAWLQRKVDARSPSRDRRSSSGRRSSFKLKAPDER